MVGNTSDYRNPVLAPGKKDKWKETTDGKNLRTHSPKESELARFRRFHQVTAPIEVLLGALGMKRSRENDLEVPLRVRVSEDTLTELNALEAFLQGHGFREVSRSALVRAALTSYLDGVRAEVPEALTPPERKLSPTR